MGFCYQKNFSHPTLPVDEARFWALVRATKWGEAIDEFRKTGDQKVINSVVLKLTDGTDTFLGEITGERAVSCPKYDPQYIYKVQCSMVVREWNSQQTGEAMQATTIYVDKINMM